ncbi:MAG: hypothetical protein AB7K52_08285 [Phycisphaerales bacterium]
MSPSTIQDRPDLSIGEIRSAVERRVAMMPPDIREALRLRLNSDSIVRTRVDWLVRVDSDASPAVQKSFELHRALSDLQRGVEEDLKAFVTVLLNH